MKILESLQRLLQKENLGARIISLIVAVGLWMYVMTEQNPIVERNVEVRLRQANLSNTMMVFNAPEKIMVRVRGSRTNLNEGVDNHVMASIDLRNITEGQQSLPVRVTYDAGEVVSVKPDRVSVYVDTVSQKTVPVVTRVVGSAADDMTVGHAKITPSEVILQGATHRIDKVNKVVAPIDVTDHDGAFSAESDLVAVSDDGYDIPNMKILPARVMVEASMVRQMLTVELPVELVLSGELPEGVRVSRTEIAPEKVRITAPPSVLNGLLSIKTKPLDVSQITASTAPAVELNLPDKVLPEISTVQVKLSIEKNTNNHEAKD